MPRLLKPTALPPGGVLGVAAPAFAADRRRLAAGRRALEAAGLSLRCDRPVFARHGYLAGADAGRARALHALLGDPEVDAVVCARGGYGCQRMLPALDAALLRRARKPLLGFSDVTSLLLFQLRRAGLVGFHGPVLERSEPLHRREIDSLRRALAGEVPAPMGGRGRVAGVARGRLVGGSLTLLAASLGTPWEVPTEGAILLFEEVGEKPYALDRLLTQLAAAGKLAGVVGVGVGHLVGCVDRRRPRPAADRVVMEILSQLGVPVVTGLPFGHRRPNLTWPMGTAAEIDGGEGRLRFLEAGATPRRSRPQKGRRARNRGA